MAALIKGFGSVGTIYSLQQLAPGSGDYTSDREKLLDGISLDEIISKVREFDEKNISWHNVLILKM
jgi:hypothetical protein